MLASILVPNSDKAAGAQTSSLQRGSQKRSATRVYRHEAANATRDRATTGKSIHRLVRWSGQNRQLIESRRFFRIARRPPVLLTCSSI